MIRILRYCWLGIGLLLTLAVQAQPRPEGVGPGERYFTVQDLAGEWLVFDERERSYVPYIPELHGDEPALSAFVDLDTYRHYKLLVSSGRGGHLYLDATLQGSVSPGSWRVLDVDSLRRVFRKPRLFLTLYGAPGADDKQLIVGHPRQISPDLATQRDTGLSASRPNVAGPSVVRLPTTVDDGLNVRPRTFSAYNDFLVLALLFLLATHAFLYTFFRRAFLRFYDPRDLLELRVREEQFLVNRPLSTTNLLFTLNLSFVVSYLLLLVQSRNIDVFASRTILLEGQGVPTLVADYFLLSGVVFGLLMGKYLLLAVLGGLYKFSGLINLHFFKDIQASLLFYVVVVLLLVILAQNVPTLAWPVQAMLVVAVAFYVTRLALLYGSLRTQTPAKNLYLFSYLCLVELIPLIIGIRFAL